MATYKVKICDVEQEITKTRGRAIKAYCTDCSNGQPTEVRECTCTLCPLYIFRGYMRWDGKKNNLTDENREKARQRLRKSPLKSSVETVEKIISAE